MKFVLDQVGVDPPSACRSSDVFGGCEGGKRVVESRDEATELLVVGAGPSSTSSRTTTGAAESAVRRSSDSRRC
ncbi:hypothetical protein ACFQ51_46725 [Streptomyces kaempferi]